MVVTLLDREKAKVGYKFKFLGCAPECSRCELARACVGKLEKGRVYEVTKVNYRKKFPCKLYGEVYLVEVRVPELLVAIPSQRAHVGAIITFTKIKCEKVFCEEYKYCDADGLRNGDKIEIIEEVEEVNCSEKGRLSICKVRLKQMQQQRAP